MAIYIQIRKTEEDATGALYKFGPSEGFVGTVFVEKATRAVSLLHIDDPKREEFYLSRIRRALQPHLDAGEFPESAYYAA